MIPSQIRADHVHAAIAEIDKDGVPAWRQSVRYYFVHQGRRYPPKYVVSLAAKYAAGCACSHTSSTAVPKRTRFFKAWGSKSEAGAP